MLAVDLQDLVRKASLPLALARVAFVLAAPQPGRDAVELISFSRGTDRTLAEDRTR